MSVETRALLLPQRLRKESLTRGQLLASLAAESAGDSGLEADYYKISMLPPLRRLQQKTQVFPLDVQASSRSRLTHSLEVQTYAHLIAAALVRKAPEAFAPIGTQLMRCVESGALVHDLGNPPFGHFGEQVIRDWVKELTAAKGLKLELLEGEKEDLCAFNGNAQGLRLLHTIYRLNLTFTQYCATLKVPFTIEELLNGQGQGAGTLGYHQDFYSWAHAHVGVYLSERPLLYAMREARGTLNRHPFATIIEWADDLAYVLADLEDAFERALISRYDILHMCDKLTRMPELAGFESLLNRRLVSDAFSQNPSEAMFYLRDVISEAYLEDLSSAVTVSLEEFCQTGAPDFSKLSGRGLTLVKLLQDYEQHQVYVKPAIESLEISGRAFLLGILSAYGRMLYEEREAFEQELDGRGGEPYLKRLADRIPGQLKETYRRGCALQEHSEMYCRIRLLLDYISGMTDTDAEAEFHLISGL